MMRLDRFLSESDAFFERRAAWMAALLLAAFTAAAILASRSQALGFDELFTYYVARLPFSGIWPALAAGVDIHAPLDYWARHLSMAALGPGELAFRLPSIVAIAAAGVGVFALARKLSSGIGAFTALALFLTLPVFTYAHKGRNYAFMMAFSTLAIFSWQSVRERGWLQPAGLAAGLAGGLFSHYFMVLVFFPLAAGEVVRSVLLRKVNIKVWAAFCVGALPLLVMLPLIQSASHVAERFVPAFSFRQVWDIYHVLGVESAPALVLILVLVAVFGSRVRPVADAATLTALIGMVLLPALVYMLAAFRTGRLFARYALPMLIGVCVLAAPLTAGVRFGRWRPGSIVASAFAILALFSWTVSVRNTPGLVFLRKEISQLESITAATDAPIVFLDSEAYLPLQHYALPPFRKRLARLDFRPITVVDRLRPAHEMWLVRSQRDFDSYPVYWALGNVSGLERLIRDGEHLEAAGYWRREPVYRVYPARRR